MTDAQVLLALLGMAIGGLQAAALWVLNAMWRELRELRARVDAMELDLYARTHERPRRDSGGASST